MRIGTGIWLANGVAMVLATTPAARAQEAAASEPAPLACSDRPRLEAERLALKTEITNIAMSGSDRRDKRRVAGAGKMAAGTTAGLLLPFGIGLALKGTMMLAEHADKQAKAKRPKPPLPPGPDVPALIERQHEVELQLAGLVEKGCPAMPTAPAKRG